MIVNDDESIEATAAVNYDLALWRSLPPGPERREVADGIVATFSDYLGTTPLTFVTRIQEGDR
jgi:hypothetical protein